MSRLFFLPLGVVSLALGTLGLFLPLLPTVPFLLLAAYFFARGSPRLEAWLVGHSRFGPHIRDWRERGAVSRPAKRAALLVFSGSAGLGLLLLPFPWLMIPPIVALAGATWLIRRPEA